MENKGYLAPAAEDSDEQSTDSSMKDSQEPLRPEYRCLRQASDFNNVFKSFIGSSYLSFPFGFLQSGIALGLIILSVVVMVTGHCCQLIIDVKMYILRKRCNLQDSDDPSDDPDFARMAKNIRYNDIGKICLGKYGPYIVDFFLVLTQAGFCVSYFIFIGVAIHDIVPFRAVNLTHTNQSYGAVNAAHSLTFSRANVTEGSAVVALPSPPVMVSGRMDVINTLSDNGGTAESVPVHELATATAWSPDNTTASNISDIVYVSVMPELQYLVLCPLLPFILFGFIRDMRHMGPWSLLANLAIIAGYFTLLSLVLIGFTIDPDIKYFNWSKAPVFFGQVSSTFEGIGLVLPVEASMRDNAHNFTPYLRTTLALVSTILASFGILAYLKYGPTVAQVITVNIPKIGIVPFALSCALILGVTLTFPLQVFPVIEILERYILGIGKRDMEADADDNADADVDDEDFYEEFVEIESPCRTPGEKPNHVTLSYNTVQPDQCADDEKVAIRSGSNEVAGWKRNVLRVLIIVGIAGLAVLLRDNFAYVGALIGAMGSTVLGYVLPCVFHLQLERGELAWYVIGKDVFIILFGIVGGVMAVVIVLQDIIASFS